MKLIRWLLSNIILIALVLALSYAYVYWDNLTGEDTPAGKTIAWLSEEFQEVKGLLDYLKVSKDEPQVVSAQSSDTGVVTETAPVAQPAPVVEPTVAASPAADDRFVSPEVERSLSRVNDEGKTSELTTRETWINARKAFHRRDFEGSIGSYEQLISQTHDNFDAYGELGNVYFNQGKMEQAAASYYEAAAILVRLGQTERAASLLGMLNRVNPEKAKQLQELLSSKNSRS